MKRMLSMRSSVPPMPGNTVLESFVWAPRLTTDSARSPTTAANPSSKPRTVRSSNRNAERRPGMSANIQ